MSGPRDHLPTERPNSASAELDRLSTEAAFDVFQAEDARIAAAVATARAEISAAVDLVAERLSAGGRLLYVGAGTSGRLGVLDASECPPTFQTPPELVQGVIAGGEAALTRAVEGAEDDRGAGSRAMDEREVGERDVVLGISAGGTTPYVHAALARAAERGAATVFFACVSKDDVPDAADVSIRVVTGPEVLAGSTRLKAGTATKLVLNRISTLAMVRLGKVHGNLMVDVNALANAKLIQRGTTLVQRLTGLEREAAHTLLAAAGGRVKTACVMHAHAVDRDAAEERLERCGGVLRRALGDG
ncbi:MAG: N-acetylmuramic acid 6-phosphate etherase [Planctomycetota bacterium]